MSQSQAERRKQDGFRADRYPTCPHFFHFPVGLDYELCANCGVRRTDLTLWEKIKARLAERKRR